MIRRMAAVLTAVGALMLAMAVTAQAAVTHATGTTSDGGGWIADVPGNWNGTVLLYSHGYGTLAPQDAPDPTTQAALLNMGYALAGSGYDPSGSLWALGSAVRDQYETLAAVESGVLPSPPRQVLAVGTSMGGLISALENESANRRIDGALTTCGIVAGGLRLGNYQLDGEYAMSKLLAPGQSIQLIHYATAADGATAGAQLTAVATQAQTTAAGRARLALAMALLNTPTWATGQPQPAPGDYAAQEQQQFLMEFTALPFPTMSFTETGRQQIELAAGGNPNWTAGVNFRRLLEDSPYRSEVSALYRAAGLGLGRDLATLTRGADIRADAPAVRWMERHSDPTGRLQVPELDLHTIADQLVPVQQENTYRHTVGRAWRRELLRQAFVQRQIHCNFTPSELVAGVQALQSRLATGRWDDVATPASLNAAATALNLTPQPPAFIPYAPGELTGDNGPFDPFTGGSWPGGW